MNDEVLALVLLIAPVPLGILLILIFGWHREIAIRREDERRRNTPPPGGAFLFKEGTAEVAQDEVVSGKMLVAIGSFAVHLLLKLLQLLAACGLQKMVGSILVIECDDLERQEFIDRLPPVFADRIVYGFTEDAGGFRNMAVAEAIAGIKFWGTPIEQAANAVCDLHVRYTKANRVPTEVWAFVSLGGQCPLVAPVLRVVHDRFPKSQIMGFTALPDKTLLRDNFPIVKAECERRGLFGWVLADNLNGDPAANDWAMVRLLVGLTESSLHAEQSTRANNAFTLALKRERGGLLVYQLARAYVPASPSPLNPQRLFVYKQQVTDQFLMLFEKIESHQGLWSASLPVYELGKVVFDTAIAGLYPRALRTVRENVTNSRKLDLRFRNGSNGAAPTLFGQPDYETPFAGLAMVAEHGDACPIEVVRLAAVTAEGMCLSEIVKPPQLRKWYQKEEER